MAFEARVYIQGVGLYVPHTDREKLLVLFPRIERAMELGLHPADAASCRHYAVAQFDASALTVPDGKPWPNLWTTLDVAGHWVGVSVVPAAGTTLPGPLLANDQIPAMPHLPDVLRNASLGAATIHPGAWPGKKFDPSLLTAGLYVEKGVLSPSSDFEGRLRFEGERGQPLGDGEQFFSSALKLELGPVESFALTLAPFRGGGAKELRLVPEYDELEVLIRHYCDLSRPVRELVGEDGGAISPVDGEVDEDFVLNYALLEDLRRLNRRAGRLPRPRILSSWLRGSPIGGTPVKCMGASASATVFESPT